MKLYFHKTSKQNCWFETQPCRITLPHRMAYFVSLFTQFLAIHVCIYIDYCIFLIWCTREISTCGLLVNIKLFHDDITAICVLKCCKTPTIRPSICTFSTLYILQATHQFSTHLSRHITLIFTMFERRYRLSIIVAARYLLNGFISSYFLFISEALSMFCYLPGCDDVFWCPWLSLSHWTDICECLVCL